MMDLAGLPGGGGAYLWPVLGVITLFLAWTDKPKIARILFALGLAWWAIGFFGNDGSGPGLEALFSVAGIGFYLHIFSLLGGIIFSKE